jgi:hypothetical protein
MNLRMTANLVVLPVSWILWEKWIAHNPDSANQQATNSGTPLRHRSGAGDSNDYSTTVYETGKGDKIQGGTIQGGTKCRRSMRSTVSFPASTRNTTRVEQVDSAVSHP